MLAPADWQMIDTLEGLEARLGFKVYHGWNESASDTILILPIDKEKEKFIAYCWNRVNIRAELIFVAIGLPIYRLD